MRRPRSCPGRSKLERIASAKRLSMKNRSRSSSRRGSRRYPPRLTGSLSPRKTTPRITSRVVSLVHVRDLEREVVAHDGAAVDGEPKNVAGGQMKSAVGSMRGAAMAACRMDGIEPTGKIFSGIDLEDSRVGEIFGLDVESAISSRWQGFPDRK